MGKKSNRRTPHIPPTVPRIVETLNPPPADLDLGKEARWYLVYTAPRMEAKAMEGLEAAGCKTFWPSVHRVITIRKRAPIEHDVGIFPRYLFASGPLLTADPDADRVRFIVKGKPIRFPGDIDGVLDVIGSSRGGVRVPTSAIAEIARYQSKPVAPPKASKVLLAGEKMRVIDGPFMSFQATVIEAIGMQEAERPARHLRPDDTHQNGCCAIGRGIVNVIHGLFGSLIPVVDGSHLTSPAPVP